MQNEPDWLQTLYRDVKFPVQQVDIARFVILFRHGGLYADLNVFPQIDNIPLVPLGLCKMIARPTENMQMKPEWEIDVVVAIAGNAFLLELLQDMSRAMADRRKMKHYDDKPFRFIYNTTGPKQVARSLKSRGYEPQVAVFSMCTPVPDLDQHLSFGDRGRVRCHLPGMRKYDILSAYSMSYAKGDPGLQPPQAKRRRYTVKTTVNQPGNEVDEERPPNYEPQQSSLQSANIEREAEAPAAEAVKCLSVPVPTPPGYKPQQSSPQKRNMTEEAREAFNDMVSLVLNDEGAFCKLTDNTRAYICGPVIID